MFGVKCDDTLTKLSAVPDARRFIRSERSRASSAREGVVAALSKYLALTFDAHCPKGYALSPKRAGGAMDEVQSLLRRAGGEQHVSLSMPNSLGKPRPARPAVDEIGIALSLPLSLSLYEVGALICAAEAGIELNTLAGSGDGAIIAAVYAGNEPSRVAQNLIAVMSSLTGMLRTEDSIRNLLEKYIDFDRLNGGIHRLLLPLVDLETGHAHVVSSVEGRWRRRLSPQQIVAASGYGEVQWFNISGEKKETFVAVPAPHREIAALRCLDDAFRHTRALPLAFKIDPILDGVAHVAGPLSREDRLYEMEFEPSFRSAQIPTLAVEIAGDGNLAAGPQHLGHGSTKTPHGTGVGWLRNLVRVNLPHPRGSGVRQVSPEEGQRRLQAGYHAMAQVVYADRILTGPGQAQDVREFYCTFVSVNDCEDEATFISIPHFLGLDQIEAFSPQATLESPLEAAAVVAKILGARLSDISVAELEQIALGVVFNSTVPLSRSPLKGWTLSTMLGAGGVHLVEGMIGGGDSIHRVIIGTFGGSLIVFGMRTVLAPLVGYLNGWRKESERLGADAGKHDAQRLFAYLGWTTKQAVVEKVDVLPKEAAPARKRASKPRKPKTDSKDADTPGQET